MKTRFTLFFGVFAVMALSNAIVPVLPSFAGSSALQGAIYAAYFLGAFISTLPAGILSDRIGHIPLIRLGLIITVISGFSLFVITSPFPVLFIRFSEGIGAGCFVASAMSYVNTVADHERMSGYFMAMLNAGLISGLIAAGWMGEFFQQPALGILLFSCCAIIPAVTGFFLSKSPVTAQKMGNFVLLPLVKEYRYLWYSSVILVGITGVVISLYPKFSGVSSHTVGIWIALMSVSTIIAVLIASRTSLPPVQTIRLCAVMMVFGILLSYYTPMGFIVIGALAGIVMIAQMAYLADIKGHQGVAMGLFSTTSYLGMTALPFIAGLIADFSGFFITFCATAFFAATVALTIDQCACRNPVSRQIR
ncbi:MAG: MFS transporter [Methanoregula sp.]|nr:MFS transporter [Methanoregula sp.]